MTSYIIYKHTFPNNKVYIGVTSQTPERRWQKGKGYIDQEYVYKAIQKYGWENIKHEILYVDLTYEEANKLEYELISIVYKSYLRENGYNIDMGGFKKYKTSEETRKKLSLLNKGKNNPMYGKAVSDETKKKLSESLKNKPRTKEWKEKISKALKGKKHSKEVLERLSKIRKGKKWWNNGIIQTQAKECPGEGWVRGLLPNSIKTTTRQLWSKHRKGRKWWNNGIIQTQSFECPEGYVPGMLPKNKKLVSPGKG